MFIGNAKVACCYSCLVFFLFLLSTKRDTSAQKERESMKKCEGRSDGGMCIIDNQTHIHLDAHEASAFWQ